MTAEYPAGKAAGAQGSGIGVLRSLQNCPAYSDLHDAGTAIKLALSDGTSRFGKSSGHGYGFHGLFVGLANLSGQLQTNVTANDGSEKASSIYGSPSVGSRSNF